MQHSIDVRQGENPKANISEEAYGRRSEVLDLPVTSSAASHSLQESPTGSNLLETESTPVEVGALTRQVKSTSSKQKGRKHHGINKHKADCLCAVCIARRRRHERDVNLLMLENQIETIDANQLHEFKTEISLAKDDSLSPEDILNLPYSGVLHMCGTLFSADAGSVWSGPHSLNYRKVPIRDSAIHSAIAMFMEINERQ